MDNINRSRLEDNEREDHATKMRQSANDLVNEGKELASELYEQSKDKVKDTMSDAEEYIKTYSDKLVNKIHTNPLSSILVAVGVGMLLSTLFKK